MFSFNVDEIHLEIEFDTEDTIGAVPSNIYQCKLLRNPRRAFISRARAPYISVKTDQQEKVFEKVLVFFSVSERRTYFN